MNGGTYTHPRQVAATSQSHSGRLIGVKLGLFSTGRTPLSDLPLLSFGLEAGEVFFPSAFSFAVLFIFVIKGPTLKEM